MSFVSLKVITKCCSFAAGLSAHSTAQNRSNAGKKEPPGIRLGVFYGKLFSPVGCNSQYCSSLFNISLYNIGRVNRSMAWALLFSDTEPSAQAKVNVILELLAVKVYHVDLQLSFYQLIAVFIASLL